MKSETDPAFSHAAICIVINGLKFSDLIRETDSSGNRIFLCTACPFVGYCSYQSQKPDEGDAPLPEIIIPRYDLNTIRENLSMPVAQANIFDQQPGTFARSVLLRALCSATVHKSYPNALNFSVSYIDSNRFNTDMRIAHMYQRKDLQ